MLACVFHHFLSLSCGAAISNALVDTTKANIIVAAAALLLKQSFVDGSFNSARRKMIETKTNRIENKTKKYFQNMKERGREGERESGENKRQTQNVEYDTWFDI